MLLCLVMCKNWCMQEYIEICHKLEEKYLAWLMWHCGILGEGGRDGLISLPFLSPFQIPPFSSLIYICRNFQFLPRIRLRVAENCPSTTIKSPKGCRSFWCSSNSSWISNKMFIKILIRFREKLPFQTPSEKLYKNTLANSQRIYHYIIAFYVGFF